MKSLVSIWQVFSNSSESMKLVLGSAALTFDMFPEMVIPSNSTSSDALTVIDTKEFLN